VARGSTSGVVQLLCVAVFIPRKGHDVLVRALSTIPQRNWQLVCVGSLTRDSSTVAALRSTVSALALGDRIVLADEVAGARLEAYYDTADVFVLPTLYEGYGMVVAEALARGLPVVASATGGIPGLVGEARSAPAGLLVRPGDVESLSEALSKIIVDSTLRERLAEGARDVRARLATWDDAARNMARAVQGSK
jgi:glycosyltransferase involved in cell wall biosynthesis